MTTHFQVLRLYVLKLRVNSTNTKIVSGTKILTYTYYSEVTWELWPPKSPATWLFVIFFGLTSTSTPKLHITGRLLWKSTRYSCGKHRNGMFNWSFGVHIHYKDITQSPLTSIIVPKFYYTCQSQSGVPQITMSCYKALSQQKYQVWSHFPLKPHYNTSRHLMIWLKSVRPT